jgi:hypothetical protein
MGITVDFDVSIHVHQDKLALISKECAFEIVGVGPAVGQEDFCYPLPLCFLSRGKGLLEMQSFVRQVGIHPVHTAE